MSKELLLAISVAVVFFFANTEMNAEEKNKLTPIDHQLKIFPDEYSELDDIPIPNATDDEYVLKSLEKARKKYLQALTFLRDKDTVASSKKFEEAIEVLNYLTSYPGVESNRDFADLAQSIVEDYENLIKNSNNIESDSPFFITREQFFSELESNEEIVFPDFQTIDLTPEDTSIAFPGLAESHPIPGIPTNVVINEEDIKIPQTDNEYVEKSIKFLTTTGKKWFKAWLERSGKWFPMMTKIATEEGLPLEIVYLSMIESGLRPDAVSKAKAVGLWQFMRATGEDYGLNDDKSVWVDERRDPEKSTRAAMKHLRDLYNEFGNWHLALAAYNCGAGGTKKAIRRSGLEDPDYWQIRDFLPKETRGYVPLYIATAKIAMNPEAFGFKIDELKFHDEYVFESTAIAEPISLDIAAKCAGVTINEIKDLNPELITGITPPDQDKYLLKLPASKARLFEANLSKLSADEKLPWVNHIVEKRETIASLSKKYGVSSREIVSANGLNSTRSRLKIGDEIKIPLNHNSIALSSDDDDQQKSTSAPNNSQAVYHTVIQGENLFQISRKYGVRLTDLRNWNNIPIDQDNINSGTRLIIAQNSTPAESKAEPVIKRISRPMIVKHKVRKGESLGKIADDYGVSIASIKNNNRIKGNHIYPGQTLKIQTSKPASADVASLTNKTVNKTNTVKSTETKASVHKVRKGENLSSIAAKYGVTEDQIADWNPTKVKGTTVYSGTTLKVFPQNYDKGSSKASSSSVKKAPKYYTIRKGDTAWSIAKKFGVTIESMKKANKNINIDQIIVGQKIRIQ